MGDMGWIVYLGGFVLLAFIVIVTLRNRNRRNVAEAERGTETLYRDLARKEKERGGA